MYKRLGRDALAAIMEAGIDEFARCGFQPASISAVARAAGVSVGVVYKYFGDKDAFFLSCVRHSLELLDTTLQAAIGGGTDTEDCIRRLVEALQQQSRAHAAYNVMYNEITSGSCRRFAPMLAREIEQRTAEAYTALFARAQAEGLMRTDIAPSSFAFFFDNLLMMLQFSYSCTYYQQRMALFCGSEDTRDDRRIAEEMTRFILSAMKGAGPCST